MHLFSVIVANYNNGRYLVELIESIKKQSYANWELVIVDDCSTDNSVDIVTPYLQDSRIKLVQHTKNSGAGSAFNTGVKNSQGYVIGMLGADDALVPEALEKMMGAHQRYQNASLINSGSYDCDEKLTITGTNKEFRGLAKNEQLIRVIPISNFVTFKRSAYDKTEGFSTILKKAVDHDLFLKLDEVGELEFVDEPLYLYRRHGGGISQGDNSVKAAQFSLMARHHAYERRKKAGKPNLSKKEHAAMMRTYHMREAFFLRKINRTKSLRHLLTAAGYMPSIIGTKAFWSIIYRNFV